MRGGQAVTYTNKAVKEFLDLNGLHSMIRAHEAQKEGFRLHTTNKGFLALTTVFSAPNYCDTHGNKAIFVDS